MIGQRFGNYRAMSLLGEGGMGAVYLAEHPEIGRKVAVKVLRAEYSRDEQLLGRFLNEARAANAIRHPNIIEILDSGKTAEGVSYLVMELLEGESLASRLRRLGKLSLGNALEFAYQTASAVGAAHRKGIVHRDLKPDNLFVVPDEDDPARERIKVLDFGIAKLQVHAMGDSVKTRTGTLMGTPVYMSPEQALGTKEVDHRSDIYSLGVIVFEMICGKPPFFSEGFGELVHMHMNVPPPSPRSFVPSLPPAVEAVIYKMLAKKPEDRYPSMQAVQEALKHVGDGAAIAIRGHSSPDFSGGTLPTAQTPPPVEMGRLSTTFSTNGERPGSRPPARPGGKGKLVAGVLATLVVVGGGLYWSSSRGRAVAPTGPDKSALPGPVVNPPPPPPKDPKTVTIHIDSRPGGARVVRIADGVNMGTTPWEHPFTAGEGTIELRLDREGYEPMTLQIPLFTDRNEDVALKPKAAPPPPPPKLGKKHPHPAASEEPAKL